MLQIHSELTDDKRPLAPLSPDDFARGFQKAREQHLASVVPDFAMDVWESTMASFSRSLLRLKGKQQHERNPQAMLRSFQIALNNG